MAFSTRRSTENNIELIHLRDETSNTLVSVAPQHGALLHAFSIETVTGMRNVIDNYSGGEELQRDLALSFKSSKLSPFVCRIREGRYVYEEETFELPGKFIDGTAIHGLLYNKTFTVAEEFADSQRAGVLLKYHYRHDNPGYPFHYCCEVRYSLLPQQVLQVQTTVTSLDNRTLPLADGWHPYFTLGGKINDWLLYFNADAMLEFDTTLIPTGKLFPPPGFTKEQPIGDIQLDHCFLLHPDENAAACTLRNPKNGLVLAIFPDCSYPYLQVYTPPHRNSIAIENLSAAPNAFNNKMGLMLLPPHHTKTFTLHYQLSCE
jgi:aldose 1-epimerase